MPLAVPQSLAYLSNHTSYEGTKWLHCRILSVFSGRLIRMVGPRAAAATAVPVVVTNLRRSMRFCFVMDLPSIWLKEVCQVWEPRAVGPGSAEGALPQGGRP